MTTRPRLRPRTAVAALALAGAAFYVCVGLLAAAPESREPPTALADSVAAALRDARGAGAAGRAPVTLAVAEESYAAGLLEQRRQELRMAWRRDFSAARCTFLKAGTLAAAAARLSRGSTRRESIVADRAMQSAREALATLAGAEERVWMAPPLRNRLQQARALLAEGSHLMAGGAFVPATDRASAVRDEALSIATSLREVTARYADADNLARWRAWEAEAIAWSRRTGKAALVVDKDAHQVEVYRGGRRVHVYGAELGWNNVGDKRHQGDGATPEGRYKIVQMKGRGRSRYHKALLLDYPNAEDIRALDQLRKSGAVRQGTRAGGLIEIHGEGGRGKDWTDGCVAVTNAEMDELFAAVAVGTPVVIVGSRAGQGVFGSLARSLQP